MPASWQALGQHWLTAAALSRADPNLRIADGTGYGDHLAQSPAAGDTLPVSIELVAGRARPTITGLQVAKAWPVFSACFTARVDQAALNTLLLHSDVRRVQLAEGLLPQRPRGRPATPWPQLPAPAPVPGPATGTSLMLAVIDDGCPFAHADLRRNDGRRTRVVRFWDQSGCAGAPPADWGYGAEFDEATLNGWMASATDARGQVDEHLCYLRAGADQVLGATAHGAHALGLLAGARRIDSRPQRHGAPPVQRLDDDAAQADVVFVQLPRKLVQAAFPPAVEHHAIEGLRWVLDVGRARGAVRIAVSFAFEAWLGPHDGSSWFAHALRQLVGEAAGQGIVLEPLLIAGNAGDDAVHAEASNTLLPLPATGYQASFHWHLPPDAQCVTQLELWLPNGQPPADLTLELTTPGGQLLDPLAWGAAAAWPSANAPAVCVVMDDHSRALGLDADVVVLRFAPTARFGAGPVAPHGEWTLVLRSATDLAGLNLYIGRGTASMNAPPRGRQARLTRRSPAQTEIDRRGSLSGFAGNTVVRVATACVSPYVVQGGPHSMLQPGRAAPYAGFGPSPDGQRPGPDVGVVVEHGVLHVGTLGIGTRSAAVLRLTGTSVAAPLGARLTLAGQAPTPLLPPGQAGDLREIGTGRFDL